MSETGRIKSLSLIRNGNIEATVLPSAAAVLGFQFHGAVRTQDQALSDFGITGLQSSARTYHYAPNTSSILVHFVPQGLASFGVPACELRDRSVSLEELLPPQQVRSLRQQMLESEDASAATSILRSFLNQLPSRVDRKVELAIGRISRIFGDASIGRVQERLGIDEEARVASIARELDLSERQLERRFLDRVGVSPKRFASLLRFEKAARLATMLPTLSQVAAAAGYYDQAHFIRECHRFTGRTPGAIWPKT